MLLSSQPPSQSIKSQSLKDVFFCPEESSFYAYCLETMVLNGCVGAEAIVEFGSGDGSPVIRSLLRSDFDGVVHGFELNQSAGAIAKARIQEYGLSDRYQIHCASFFEAERPEAIALISNPPYLPAWDNDLYQPLLHGGTDGITLTKRLLSLDYDHVLVMVSSYSNPAGLVEFAAQKGYCVSNFLVSPLPFGYYSSEPKVKDRIAELRSENKAFYSNQIYFLAGVLFTQNCETDLSDELVRVMTALSA
jgi:methylase of polypeptide subunit release factors